MVELIYQHEKIDVPTSWDDIPLRKYETFYKSRPSTHRERVDLIAQLCGVSGEQLRQWPASAFNIVLGHMKFVFEDDLGEPNPNIVVDGVQYGITLEDELTLGAWIDAEMVQKEGVDVLSNVLAIVCRPAGEPYDDKNNEKRAAMFANMPTSRVLGLLSFFLQCRRALEANTIAYTALRQLADRLPRSIKPLLKRGAGIKWWQIWPIMKYYALTQLLRYQLGKLSRSYSTANIKKLPTKRKEN